MPGSDRVRAHVRVHGQVQGVFFRTETRDRARSRRVAGWVRNCPDGSLEAIFEGERDAVESLLRWAERGPAGARVDEVEVEWGNPAGERDFAVR